MFLMGRWRHLQLKPGVQGGKLVVGRGRDGGRGEGEKEGVVLSSDEFRFGNIMNLVSCQTSEDDCLVSWTHRSEIQH